MIIIGWQGRDSGVVGVGLLPRACSYHLSVEQCCGFDNRRCVSWWCVAPKLGWKVVCSLLLLGAVMVGLHARLRGRGCSDSRVVMPKLAHKSAGGHCNYGGLDTVVSGWTLRQKARRSWVEEVTILRVRRKVQPRQKISCPRQTNKCMKILNSCLSQIKQPLGSCIDYVMVHTDFQAQNRYLYPTYIITLHHGALPVPYCVAS